MKMNDLGVPLFTLILGNHHMNGNNEHNEDIRGLYKQQMVIYDDIYTRIKTLLMMVETMSSDVVSGIFSASDFSWVPSLHGQTQ